MRMIFAAVLVVGMGLAGFAVYMARDYVSAYQYELDVARQAQAQVVETVPVFIATRELRYGQTLNPEDVRAVNFPVDAIAPGAFHDAAVLFPDGEDELFQPSLN